CNSACVRDKKTKKDVCNEEANGSETYVMGLHKTEGNLEVAKRENDAAMYEDNYQQKYNMAISSDEATIILSAYQNLYLEQSMRFAQLCQQQFSTKAGRDDKGVKQAGFLVLWKTSMPSVLIETGFLSSPSEERFLNSDKGQNYMASSIFRAFRAWKDEIEGTPHKYDDAIENMKPWQPDAGDTSGLKKPVNYVAIMNGTAGAKHTPPPAPDTVKPVPPADSTPVKNSDPPKDSVVTHPATTGVVYRVQIIASDKPIDANSAQFKGVTDTWHYVQGGVYKYTAGKYLTMADASRRQADLKKQGFDQAFIVAFDKNGNRITIDEAKKQNGGK
ncbi:MAG TPA: N-acetylmuramoyl-L-alanine amidase, partial [Bacteroidia bacterium]|nr:N-acetylmuramoyl-L-alanine amidase [Bacteroidia bacterium]